MTTEEINKLVANQYRIVSLCSNPHWTTDRKYRIQKLAEESIGILNSQPNTTTNETT